MNLAHVWSVPCQRHAHAQPVSCPQMVSHARVVQATWVSGNKQAKTRKGEVERERWRDGKWARTYIIGDLFCPHPVILAHLTLNTVILIAQTHHNNNL